MRRFRPRRRRRAAVWLFAAAAMITIGVPTHAATAGEQRTAPRFDAEKKKVRPGAKVRLRGQFSARATPATMLGGESAPQPPGEVRIQFRPAGKDHYDRIAVTETDGEGKYVHRTKVRRSGHFRAVASDGRVSEPDRVRVKSRVRARLGKDDVNLGDKLKVKGNVAPAIGRRKVVVKVGNDRVTTKTNRRGRFTARWKADETGAQRVRVKARGDEIAAGSKDKAGKATVYRPAEASYYGPGFYGNRTACGQTLGTSTIGVAHKTMPCGKKLKLRYRNRTVKVKVIDRGPYVAGREFDLTEATKNRLRFPSTGTVWVNK